MILSLIVAVAENQVIGNGGQMPWHISEDLKYFKRTTQGHPVVMGRRTFESLGCRPLPNRTNVVVSRNTSLKVPEGVVTATSLEQALAPFQQTDEEVFILGGGEIYRQAMPLADRLYLTRIAASPQGDTLFPTVSPEEWRLTWHEAHPATDHTPAFEFCNYLHIKR